MKFVPLIKKDDIVNGYAIEMHAHVQGTSGCAQVGAEDMIRLYKEHHYSCIVLTSHYGYWNESTTGLSGSKLVDMLKARWEECAEIGKEQDITVLYGMELTFDAHPGDYLIYGFDWDFMYKNAFVHRGMTIDEFCPFARENGILIYQAHPFRYDSSPVSLDCLDGLEVYNGHPGHDSRPELAYNAAVKHRLRMISGSDCHFAGGHALGGIVSCAEIKNIKDLMEILRNEDYFIIADFKEI